MLKWLIKYSLVVVNIPERAVQVKSMSAKHMMCLREREHSSKNKNNVAGIGHVVVGLHK